MNSHWTDIRRRLARLAARFLFESRIVRGGRPSEQARQPKGGWIKRDSTQPVFVTLDEETGWYESAHSLMTPAYAQAKSSVIDSLPSIGSIEPDDQQAELDSSVYVMN